MRALVQAWPVMLLAGLMLVSTENASAQIHFQNGEPYMTVRDPGQAVPVGGPKKGARPLAGGNKVYLHSVADGWATVELDEPEGISSNVRRYRLPLTALSGQPGKTFADKPAWLPSPAEATAVARDVAAYEDDQSIMVLEGAAKPRRIGQGTSPALSPDGSLLAYSPAPEGGVTVVDLGGRATPRHFAAKPTAVREIHFSYDGRRLAWRVDDRRPAAVPFAPHDRIEIADLSQPAPKPVVVVGEQSPEVSFQGFNRGGTALVLFDYNAGSGLVRWLGLDGKTLRQEPITTFTDKTLPSSADTYLPSPADDNLLLVESGVNPTPAMQRWLNDTGSALFLYDAQSGTNYRLTPRTLAAVTPAWTPDGRRIYFSGLPETPANGRHRLYRMNADGTGLTDLGKGFAPSVGTRP
ncbi:TolB family protein [Desulfovibrio sp. TomC]|uniref:TolB family protein n=1 Tax=Desulfovibrio sp. TomC TaxID=1562888 RepID=UPI0005743429|nr:biopolymer transporter Tol [Desulfovibrio sp. TomC]KHK00498.1 hypothetical protein NY78_4059 [Desulfovibrio sp. TomC]